MGGLRRAAGEGKAREQAEQIGVGERALSWVPPDGKGLPSTLSFPFKSLVAGPKEWHRLTGASSRPNSKRQSHIVRAAAVNGFATVKEFWRRRRKRWDPWKGN